MKLQANNVNIRGCEKKTNKKGEPYLLVRYEDESGKPEEIVDKDMSREPYYKRDTVGTLYVDLEIKKWTTLRVIDFKVKTDD